MKAADVLMMPYDTEMEFSVMDIKQTSPLKLFEYMGSNRPILSTNIPTISKIITNNVTAMLAEPNNIKMQAEYVNELLDNPAKAAKIAELAYTDVIKYEWSNRCKIINEKFIRNKQGKR